MKKRSTTERGYGADHQRRRARWAPKVATGRVICWRCGQPIRRGEEWDLGHDDSDPTKRTYKGPEHRSANRRAGAVKGNRIRRARRRVSDAVSTLRW